MTSNFDFCVPTTATTAANTPDWLHEIKDDAYRLIVQRDGDRVRLIMRGAYNWTNRYPWTTTLECGNCSAGLGIKRCVVQPNPTINLTSTTESSG
jgi:ATP-dependent DNA ligase